MSGSAEKSQLRSQHSMLDIHWHASETAFRWQADDGLLKVGLGSSLPSSTLKTNVVKVGSPLTKPSGSAHESCPSTVKFQSSRFTRTACMRGSRTFVRGVVREDRNAIKNGPPSAHQRNAIVDNGPPMNAGLVAL